MCACVFQRSTASNAGRRPARDCSQPAQRALALRSNAHSPCLRVSVLILSRALRPLRYLCAPECRTMYIELHTSSAFSFLDGASLPEALVERAAALGYPAVGLLDRDGVYGAPRFHVAAKRAGLKGIVGAELTISSGTRDSGLGTRNSRNRSEPPSPEPRAPSPGSSLFPSSSNLARDIATCAGSSPR